jgi:hypothetical protein
MNEWLFAGFITLHRKLFMRWQPVYGLGWQRWLRLWASPVYG